MSFSLSILIISTAVTKMLLGKIRNQRQLQQMMKEKILIKTFSKTQNLFPLTREMTLTTARKQLLPILDMIQWIALVLLAQCILTKQSLQV